MRSRRSRRWSSPTPTREYEPARFGRTPTCSGRCSISQRPSPASRIRPPWRTASWAAVQGVMPATCCAIYLYESRNDLLSAAGVSGEHSAAIDGLTIPLGQRLTGWVAAHRATIVNSDAALDLGNLAMRLQPAPHSCVSTVLARDNDLVGVITMYSTGPAPFTERDAAI